MTDQFQLREDSAAAWLAFKRDLGVLLTPENEELLRLTFVKGFADGWGKGAGSAFDQSIKTISAIS
jgi:hypothetical protein